MLHTKAFGQDVFQVEFSADREGRLCTSGTGHIRFWKMAQTFTGLKLQARAAPRRARGSMATAARDGDRSRPRALDRARARLLLAS